MENRQNLLKEGVQKGYIKMTSDALENGASADRMFANGETALGIAASNGFFNIVRLLLSHKANPNAKDRQGDTPLILACRFLRPNKIDVLKLLVDSGADVNIQDKLGNTPLIASAMARNLTFFRFLVENGADMDLKNKEGKTGSQIALNHAINVNDSDFVGFLLQHGKIRNEKHIAVIGRTPLFDAVNDNCKEIVRLILKSPGIIDYHDRNGMNAFMLAIERNNRPMIDLFLNWSGTDFYDPLLLRFMRDNTLIRPDIKKYVDDKIMEKFMDKKVQRAAPKVADTKSDKYKKTPDIKKYVSDKIMDKKVQPGTLKTTYTKCDKSITIEGLKEILDHHKIKYKKTSKKAELCKLVEEVLKIPKKSSSKDENIVLPVYTKCDKSITIASLKEILDHHKIKYNKTSKKAELCKLVENLISKS